MKGMPILTVYLLSCGLLAAPAAVLPQLPPCDTPVAEVAASHPLGQDWTNLRRLDFRLEFVGTASNNVEVAFGRDLDANGELEPHETRIVVGWECGRYFVEDFRSGVRSEEGGSTNATDRVLTWSYALKGDERRLKAFSATADGAAAFGDIASDPPGWLYGPDWDTMRLVARGVDVQDERFTVTATRVGTTILLR